MVRCCRFAVAFLVVAGFGPAWEAGAQQPGAPEKPGKIPAIPAFSLLGVEPVQVELKLTAEQRQKARDLIAEFDKQSRADMAALQQVPPQEQQAKMSQLQQASAKRMEALRAQLEALLTPQQLAELEQIAFQMSVIVNPQVLEQLGLSEQQRQAFDQLRNQAQAKMWDVQREMGLKTFNLLTAEQRKALQSLVVQSPAAQ